MAEGDKWRIYLPYDLAYGEDGVVGPPRIPPYSVVIFDIELHKVVKGGKVVSAARGDFKRMIAPPDEDDSL